MQRAKCGIAGLGDRLRGPSPSARLGMTRVRLARPWWRRGGRTRARLRCLFHRRRFRRGLFVLRIFLRARPDQTPWLRLHRFRQLLDVDSTRLQFGSELADIGHDSFELFG